MSCEAHAATINVPAGGNFQTALNNALPGDVIVLQAGATYFTSSAFTLPNKGTSTNYITIQSSALANLPGAGYRVGPQHSRFMPKLAVTANALGVMTTQLGAHHYQFVGIEMMMAPNIYGSAVLELGKATETSLDQLPHHITVDRCYIHVDPVMGTKRGITLNGA
jgi:hypothetical protein